MTQTQNPRDLKFGIVRKKKGNVVQQLTFFKGGVLGGDSRCVTSWFIILVDHNCTDLNSKLLRCGGHIKMNLCIGAFRDVIALA